MHMHILSVFARVGSLPLADIPISYFLWFVCSVCRSMHPYALSCLSNSALVVAAGDPRCCPLCVWVNLCVCGNVCVWKCGCDLHIATCDGPLYPLPSVNVTCDPREKVIALCSHIHTYVFVCVCCVYMLYTLSDVEPQFASRLTVSKYVCLCVCVCSPILVCTSLCFYLSNSHC